MFWTTHSEGSDARSTLNRGRDRRAARPSLEGLEGRQLLSASRTLLSGGGVYNVTLDGPGNLALRPSGRGVVDLLLLGTTDQSALSVDLTRTFAGFSGPELGIRRLVIRTGELGAINAPQSARLLGPATPIRSDVSTVSLAEIGPDAQLVIDGDLGTLSTRRDASIGPFGALVVTGDVTGDVTIGGDLTIDGGLVSIGRDLRGDATIGGDLVLDGRGVLYVGRDVAGTLAIDGDLLAGAPGGLVVGRDLGRLVVVGDLDLAAGGVVRVLGDLGSIEVDGTVRGDGFTDEDIRVGLSLGGFLVRGGATDQPGVRGLDLDVGKTILGIDVAHGIFESFITAGVLIDGVDVGPDGPVAIRNTEIRAGVQLRNLRFNGDVVTDRSLNLGRPTRIIAGLDRAGNAIDGSSISALTITGALIDAVVASSVTPGGPFATFDAPGGVTIVGPADDPIAVPNFTAPPFDRALDPSIDDVVGMGAIEANVLGGVVSTRTPEQEQFDYAGLFAADTSGVRVGNLPGN